MLRISKTSKLDGIRSWSLQAIDTCPGSKAPDGGLVEACRGCYATQGNYRFPSVKQPREENREDWKRTEWVAEMVEAIGTDTHWRWFDSGDCYAIGLAEKILQVMQRTPNCQHWLPTRMYKFDKFLPILEAMQALPNVSVRYSADEIVTEPISSIATGLSVILADAKLAGEGITVCKAYENAGKCSGCRACWNKSVGTIGYVAHGRSIAKVIKLKLERK